MPDAGDPAAGAGDAAPEERGATGRSAVAEEQLLYADHLVRIACTVLPGPSMIRVIGEVDRSNSAEVLRTLERARHIDDKLIIDVGKIAFVDITGARTLAMFAKDDTACVRNIPHQMDRLLRLLRLPPYDGPDS